MTGQRRQEIAVQALAHAKPIVNLASEADVSRKFVYSQSQIAERALNQAFAGGPSVDNPDVLFWFPVTRERVEQMIVDLTLDCHSSFRGAIAFLHNTFDYDVSLGTVHNILSRAIQKAREINQREDLSSIRFGAHDEIFQGTSPVLVGVHPPSTYCYLLAQEAGRDATTWGVHLLDLSERGLDVDYTIADAGKGLRAGQAEAWPGKPCWGDTFHAIHDAGKMTTYLDNRAFGRIAERDKLERKMQRAKKRAQGQSVSKELAIARQDEAQSVQLADDMRLLVGWLRDDILCYSGPDTSIRRELFDFVVSEMKAREHLASHRIAPIRTALENQRDDLLAFAEAIDAQLRVIAADFQVPLALVRQAFELSGRSPYMQGFHQTEACLWELLGERYHTLKGRLAGLHDLIARASSMVENINSRLRAYFFLRREVGTGYLELLRFFLNHRRFPRSREEARAGKSPAELLAGKQLPHWLEQLDFTLFRQPDHARLAKVAA